MHHQQSNSVLNSPVRSAGCKQRSDNNVFILCLEFLNVEEHVYSAFAVSIIYGLIENECRRIRQYPAPNGPYDTAEAPKRLSTKSDRKGAISATAEAPNSYDSLPM